MDDKLSIKSSDSVTTSGEYEIVAEDLDVQTSLHGTSPTLNIANNGNINDLEKNLTEVIHELDQSSSNLEPDKESETHTGHNTSSDSELKKTGIKMASIGENVETSVPPLTNSLVNDNAKLVVNKTKTKTTTPDVNKVGQSVFYDCLELEKQDFMKPESDTDEEMSDIDQDCTEFAGVTYLGSANINAPRSETEILRRISEMNSDSAGFNAAVSIPSCSEGYVVCSLHDGRADAANAVVGRFLVSRIIFYFRGPVGSSDQACFAFTFQTSGDTAETDAVFQCHVFRCTIPEAVNQVSSCFAKAFQRPMIAPSMTTSITSAVGENNNIMTTSILSDTSGNPISSAGYEFIVSLQIREKLAKTSHSTVSRDRSGFKLRCNTDKEFTITVNQIPPPNLPVLLIERSFGVLLNPGKLLRQSDMRLLDFVSVGYLVPDGQSQSQTQTASASGSTAPYVIRGECKANDKHFIQLNVETAKLNLTVAVDLVIRGIQEPVRFVIETAAVIQPQSLMDHFNLKNYSKKTLSQRFYLQLEDSGDGGWKVSSIDPSEEIVEPSSSNYAQSSWISKNLGFNNFSKMTRSVSAISIEHDDSVDDYSSDGDEPLLSGTGDVPKDCPEDISEWNAIVGEIESGKRPKNMANLIRMGIPRLFRNKIWQYLANVENNTKLIDVYRVLLTKETKFESVIQRDIHRTFPAHEQFKEIGGSGQDALFKVSKAYAVYDTEVGYCQGLSFIAASLLILLPEEEAFCTLIAIMYNYGLRDLYKDGFDMLYLYLYQLNRLMKDQLPKLYEHFEQMGVETHMFASQWFLTLFTARFPLYLVFYILDVFLLDGMQILFQVSLTLLTEFESEMRTLDFEGILKYFRVTLPKRCRSKALARKLMKRACERKVKKLKQYRDEFFAQKEMAEKKEAAIKEYESHFEEERNRYKTEIVDLQTKLKQAIEKNKLEEGRKISIIDDYKQIIQRHEHQITKLTEKVSKCEACSSVETQEASPLSESADEKSLTKQAINNLGPLDPLINAQKQIKELELSLAQTKLDLVESQCRNQDLTHQMNTLIAEIQSNRNSWQPWLTKTFTTIQEKVASSKREPTFLSYTSQPSSTTNNSSEQNQVSQNMRPKSLISPLSSTGRTILDFNRTDLSPENNDTGNPSNSK